MVGAQHRVAEDAGAAAVAAGQVPGNAGLELAKYRAVALRHLDIVEQATERIYLIEDQVDAVRFSELVELSESLDDADEPKFDFLTDDERRKLELAIAEKDLERHSSNGTHCLAHISVETDDSQGILEFEAVIEDDGTSFQLLTPYDKQAGKFEDLSNCVTDSW